MEKAIKQFNRGMLGVSIAFFGVLALWLGLTDAVDPPYFNVGFTASWVVACLAIAFILLYAKRRSTTSVLTWGEAMVGATLIFALMFWVYGVVPHLWITFSDSELSWRFSRILDGPTLPSWWSSSRQGLVSWALPFDLNYRVLRDLVAVIIYALALSGNLALFLIWQKRGQPPAEEIPDRSKYGRPLLKGSEELEEAGI